MFVNFFKSILVVVAILHFSHLVNCLDSFLYSYNATSDSIIQRVLFPLRGLPSFLSNAQYRPGFGISDLSGQTRSSTPNNQFLRPNTNDDFSNLFGSNVPGSTSFDTDVGVLLIDPVFFDRPLNVQPLPSSRDDLSQDNTQTMEPTNNHGRKFRQSNRRSQPLDVRQAGYIDLNGNYHGNLRQDDRESDEFVTLQTSDLEELWKKKSSELDLIQTCKFLSAYYKDYANVCCSKRDGDWHNSLTWDCGRIPNNLDVVAVFHKVTLTKCMSSLTILSLWIISTGDQRAYLYSGHFFRDSVCSKDERTSMKWAHLENDLLTLFEPIISTNSIQTLCKHFDKAKPLNLNSCTLSVGEPEVANLHDILVLNKKLGIFVAANSGLLFFNGTQTILTQTAQIENRGVFFFFGHSCSQGECSAPSLYLKHAHSTSIQAHQPIYVHDMLVKQTKAMETLEHMQPPLWLGFIGYPIRLPDSFSSTLTLTDGLYSYRHGLPRLIFAFSSILIPIESSAGPVIFLEVLPSPSDLAPNTITIFTDAFKLISSYPVELKSDVILAFPAGNLRFRDYVDSYLDLSASKQISYSSVQLKIVAIVTMVDYLVNESVSENGPKNWKNLSFQFLCQQACHIANQLFLPEPNSTSRSIWV